MLQIIYFFHLSDTIVTEILTCAVERKMGNLCLKKRHDVKFPFHFHIL